MTYIVLARKWRPRKFEDVVGQEHVTRTLQNALKQGRLGHAFIFAGPRGVGKTTTARLLARAVNSEDPAHFDQLAERDPGAVERQNLDIIEIDGASNRGIDEIRNLRENVRFAPVSSKYKIYIIDEVHMLSKEAFNALLKTLEEPPSHVIFIFATTEIHKVPLTILSRCQRFDFKRIPTSQIADQLDKICQNENIAIDHESLLLIARKAEGSMRDATSILDQIISFASGEVSVEEVRNSLGIINEELFFEYSELMAQRNDAGIIQFVGKLFESGYDIMNFIHGLEEHFRNLLISRATGSAKSLETSDYFKSLYEKKGPEFAEKDLLHYLDILVQNEQLLKYSENSQLILELLLLKLAHKPLSVELEELLNLLKKTPALSGDDSSPTKSGQEPPSPPSPTTSPTVKKKTDNPVPSAARSFPAAKKSSPKDPFAPLKSFKLSAGSAAAGRASSSPEKSAPESAPATQLTLAQVSQQWNQIVAAVKKAKIALASFLEDGVPYQIDHQFLQIAFDPKTGFHMEHVQKNAPIIEKIMANIFHQPLKIKCVKIDFEKEGIKKQIQSPEEMFENMKNKEPVLKKIIELFDCENLDS